jgi:uncharacterized protein
MPLPSMKDIEPTQLTLNSRFKFRCHKGVKCFTQCCSKIDILLTPYDILRMKNRLGITSEEFLEKYTYMHIDEKTSHPFALLKMSNDKEGKCPFVTADGCTIYTDRPLNCRYYPVGQAIHKKLEGKKTVDEEFYFFVREAHCLGYQSDREWSINEWKVNQSAELYDDMNREWKTILLRDGIPGQERLNDQKRAMFYMASYDLDRFKSYIFGGRFLDVFDIDRDEIEKIKTDEIALMKFGFKYLKYILMLEETLKVKKEYLKNNNQ